MTTANLARRMIAFGVVILSLVAINSNAISGNCNSSSIGSTPCSIATPGHYTLTASLTGAANVNAINVNVNDVVLDMAGWNLTGGSGADGVYGGSSENTTVRIGHSTSSGYGGIVLGNDCDIEQVIAFHNSSYVGIYPNDNSIVLQNIATGNDWGIWSSYDDIYSQNVATGSINYELGSTGSLVADNAVGNAGMDFGSNVGYGRNVSSTSSCVSGSGTSMGDNVCNGTKQ